jgi:hypothetical protein
MEHTTFPRIKLFSSGRMRSMLLADSRRENLHSPQKEYAVSKVITQKNLKSQTMDYLNA